MGDGDGLFVDDSSGEVFFVGAHDGAEWHVNDSLRRFVQSLNAFNEAYPFYGADAAVDVREAAASRLRVALSTIDPISTRDDPGFWNTIIFDVAIGDYGDEEG